MHGSGRAWASPYLLQVYFPRKVECAILIFISSYALVRGSVDCTSDLHCPPPTLSAIVFCRTHHCWWLYLALSSSLLQVHAFAATTHLASPPPPLYVWTIVVRCSNKVGIYTPNPASRATSLPLHAGIFSTEGSSRSQDILSTTYYQGHVHGTGFR